MLNWTIYLGPPLLLFSTEQLQALAGQVDIFGSQVDLTISQSMHHLFVYKLQE